MLNPESNPDKIIQEVLSLLKKAAIDKKDPMRFVILGSLNFEMPELRYVVWRNFDAKDLSGHIYTDIRSNKIKQLRENPLAQLLFYHPDKKIQVKVNVKVLIHNNTEKTNTIYKQMNKGQEAYNTLRAPGTKRNNFDDTNEMKSNFSASDFTILETKFLSMEVLKLQYPNHIRLSYHFINRKFEWLVP